MSTLQAFAIEDLLADNTASSERFTEFLRVPMMSAGIYALPAGSVDGQSPHDEDEIYYVLSGRSKFVCDDEVVDVVPGSFLFVAKDAVHRFFDIEEDLQIIVVFAPEHRVKTA
jgi:mannose-6-phosphate isomerase-like protein (cupin superfamily)